jgi:hypothetical protein
MLDTVLHIGEIYRNSPDGFKYHRYIRTLSKKEKEKTTFLSLPVNADGSFDFEQLKEIADENIIENKLFYLSFKTSDQDGAIKYVYGDIYYGKNKEKEFGNYRIEINVFKNGYKYIKDSKNTSLLTFAKAFEREKGKIEERLVQHGSIYLHFDFSGKHWYEQGVLDEINRIMVDNFTDRAKEREGVVFKSMLYKTLCSGDKKNDVQFPAFSNANKHKARLFDSEDVVNLFYGIDYLEKPTLSPYMLKISKSSEKIKVVILPREEESESKLTAQDYEEFTASREGVIKAAIENGDDDWSLSGFLQKVNERIIAYDVIFVKEGSHTETDLIEISGLDKSFLKSINERINRIREESKREYNEYKRDFFIIDSLKNLLDDNTSALRKYQSHLQKVLPKIYTGSYYYDPYLLPLTVEKIEMAIRKQDGGNNYSIDYRVNQLRQDLCFLTKIQNTEKIGENLMKIITSSSYRMGLKLGKMAKPLRKEINSFEKNYVGSLTRRIASIEDLIKFKTFIEEKLVIHDVCYPDIKEASLELAKEVKNSPDQYDKTECAFGFFESYFAYPAQKTNKTIDSDNL